MMKLARAGATIVLTAIFALVLTLSAAWALEPGPDGYYHTGSGIRTKSVAFVDVKVYEINHYMKKLPDTKSKRAVIDLDVDKKITWKMLRDVDADRIQSSLKDAFRMNGYSDGGKIGKLTSAFTSELKEGSRVSISYDSGKKVTTVAVQGGGTASVEGVDFMKATWSIWFGNIDQPKLGDAMISRIP